MFTLSMRVFSFRCIIALSPFYRAHDITECIWPMGLGILIESYLRFQICFRCCLVDSKCQSIKYRQKGFGSSSKNTQISVSQAYHGYFLLCGLETAFLCYHPDDFFFFFFFFFSVLSSEIPSIAKAIQL